MSFAERYFLGRYYLDNLLFSKIGGRILSSGLEKFAPQWETLKRQHGGHEHWLVVGNGPSLKAEDLEAMAHVPSIASNKINLLFKRTSWRPTLYTASDNLVLFKAPREQYEELPRLLAPDTGYYMARTNNKLPFRAVIGEARLPWLERIGADLDPIRTGFFDGNTVTTYNIQLALWLGARTIHVIGCDHFYKEEKNEAIKKLAHGADASNHFDPNYRKPGEIVNSAPIEKLEWGYAQVRRLAERLGARILNITRKTALPNFERGTVEESVAMTLPDRS